MLGWLKKPPPDYFALRDDVEDECQELSKRAITPVISRDTWGWDANGSPVNSAPVKGDNDA